MEKEIFPEGYDREKAKKCFLHTLHRFQRMRIGELMRGITRGEFLVLDLLHELTGQEEYSCGIQVSCLAARLLMPPPAVSRLLRTLELKGLILRKVGQEDRRNTYVSLTREGRLEWQCCRESFSEFTGHVVDAVGEKDMQTFLVLWNKVVDAMAEELKKETGKEETDDQVI